MSNLLILLALAVILGIAAIRSRKNPNEWGGQTIDDELLQENIDQARGRSSRRRIPWVSFTIVAIVVAAVGVNALRYEQQAPIASTNAPANLTSAPIAAKSGTTSPSTSLPSTPPSAPASNQKTDSYTQTEADKAPLVKAMKDAIAARHGGVLPNTMSEEDNKVAAQAAIKWKEKQAAEKSKRQMDAMKVKPLPSNGYAEIFLAKGAITKMMRDPDSAMFGDVFFVNDRKSATGYYVPVVCGTVNGRNGFGGMTGQKHFVAIVSDIASGLWLEGTTPQNVFVPEWNRFCAGQHN